MRPWTTGRWTHIGHVHYCSRRLCRCAVIPGMMLTLLVTKLPEHHQHVMPNGPSRLRRIDVRGVWTHSQVIGSGQTVYQPTRPPKDNLLRSSLRLRSANNRIGIPTIWDDSMDSPLQRLVPATMTRRMEFPSIHFASLQAGLQCVGSGSGQ